MPLQAVEKRALPDQRIEQPCRQQGKQIGCCERGDLQLWMLYGDGGGVDGRWRFSKSQQNQLKEEQQHSREADKHDRMAEVRDAARRRIGIVRGRVSDVRRVLRGLVEEEAHADFARSADAVFFAAVGFLARFLVGSTGRADGMPVFFSGAMNLPRAGFTRSAAAAMLSGCGPAWLRLPLPFEEI